ncbi:LamG-like jellyroll fold domain-containing protein [Lentzea sp. NPDC051838]|uniref:LamG-like jellyroll fold domain-containing protein n=1 Tax=Lentzea sp. NPDC051838 TaxID=3154849 RepID=UPI0034245CBD
MRRAGEAQGFVLRAFVTFAVMSTFVVVPARAAEPECVDTQPTAATATEMAKRCDRRVEITELRKENAQTFAKPGGGYTTEQSVEPRWARQGNGSWARIDTTLRVSGSTVAPVAAVLPVEFSDGGTGPAARLRDGDRELSITWPLGALPRPVLSGAAATYAEVLPGVDLKLTASAQGFSQLLVVKNREAAKNPNIAKVAFGFGAKGLTTQAAGGGLEAKDASGRVVFMSPTPLMWDSGGTSGAGVSAKAASADPPKQRTAAMPIAVQNGEISVVPDAAMLSDAATQYPVMIDPSWTGRVLDNAWTLVSSKDPAWGYWQGRNNQGNYYLVDGGDKGAAGAGLICDNVSTDGRCLSDTYKVRSYFRMDISGVKGKVVTGASFKIEQRWAFTCNPNSNATVRVADEFSGGTTWNNQPNWWGDAWASTSPANRKVGATHSCSGPGDVEFEFTGVVSNAVNTGWHNITVTVHSDDRNVNFWKRFNASSALLSIDYNSVPNQPDQVTVDGKGCATGDARPVVPTATPTMRGRVSDPDGDTLDARFEWRRIRPNGSRATTTQVDRSSYGSGYTADYTVPKPDSLPNGVVEASDTLVGTGDWDNDGKPDLLVRDGDGYLYLLPTVDTPAGRKSGDRVEIGTGWNGFTIAGVADWDNDGKLDIIARQPDTGDVYLYPGEGKRGHSGQPVVKIGWGWGAFTFAGVADYDRDGKQDLIAKDPNGELWIYPGEAKRAPSTQDRASLGGGWGSFAFAGVADRSGDGKPDVFAYGPSDGNLWLYLGSGTRAAYTGDPSRHLIGWGWQGTNPRAMPDLNGDNAVDIVAQVSFSSDWFFYPGVVGTQPGPDRSTIAGRGMTSGNYEYRVTAFDKRIWGPPSNWCEFTVDITAPDAPSLNSAVYKTMGCPVEGCGALGIADTFTFSSTSPDVVKYRWGFSDLPSMTVAAGTPIRWTPPSAGPRTLFVDAVDRAGLSTRNTFQFKVAGAKQNEAQWFAIDDPAVDATGHGHDLALSGLDPARAGRTVGGQSAVGFDGTATSSATTAKVLDTSNGFSVSAWVRLTGDTTNRTVVSQQGSATSAFRLGYDASSHKWTFALSENDAANATQKTAVSDATAVTGVWTHLTGTYEGRDREVRLYVDGALQRTIAVMDNGFSANGQLWVGRALRNSAPAEFWLGELADVRAWNRTITPQESLEMAGAEHVSSVGEWRFDENGGSIAHDVSPYGRDLMLNLAGGAKWGEGIDHSSGLELNGVNSSASSRESVLNTDQSFSVDVWVKLNDASAPRTVVVQRGPSTVDPFVLKFDGSQWSAEMSNAAVNPSTWWRAKADAVVNKWTHLVAVHDASARTLKLAVGYQDDPDTLKSTATGVVGWNSTGVLSVGRSSAGEYFNGNIDELKVLQGVQAPKTLDPTPRTGSSISGDANDEVISVEADGVVRAFLNVNGAYPNGSQQISSGWSRDRTWFADIDGDGRSEIIGVEAGGAIKAYRNVNGMNGSPFGAAVVIGSASGETGRIRFADVDGDGRADRVSIDTDGRVRVYRNLFGMNERGQSTAFAVTPVVVKVTAVSPDRIRFADIDGDGKAEFITVNADETVSAFRNLGGLGYGSYDISQEIATGWTPDRTWFADITGDGKAEIIKVNPDGTMWSWTNYNGLTGTPYAGSTKLGFGWHEPAQVFFS